MHFELWNLFLPYYIVNLNPLNPPKESERRKQDFLALSVEKRRHIFAGNLGKSEGAANSELRGRMQLSLPPQGAATLQVPDRRITIMSPHTPNYTPDLLQFNQGKHRNKSFVLPKLLLPNSESHFFYSE